MENLEAVDLSSPESFEAAYQKVFSFLTQELNRSRDERLLPEYLQEYEELFIGLYTAKYYPENIDYNQRLDYIKRGLALEPPQNRWTRTNSFARFTKWFNLVG